MRDWASGKRPLPDGARADIAAALRDMAYRCELLADRMAPITETAR